MHEFSGLSCVSMSHYSTEAMVWVARLQSTATQMPLSSKSKHKDRGIPLCLCTGRCVYRVRRLGGPTERGRLGGGILFALLNLPSYFHCLSSQPQPSLGCSSHPTAPACSSSSLLLNKATLGTCLETFSCVWPQTMAAPADQVDEDGVAVQPLPPGPVGGGVVSGGAPGAQV